MNARQISSSRSTSGRLTHDQRATSEAGPAGYARDCARARRTADARGVAASIAHGERLRAERVKNAARLAAAGYVPATEVGNLNLDRKPLGQ